MLPCLERWLSQASLRAALETHRAGTSRVVERKWLTFFSFFSLSRSRLAHKKKKVVLVEDYFHSKKHHLSDLMSMNVNAMY